MRSAHETNVCSTQLQQYPGSNKYFLTHTFWMFKVRKLRLLDCSPSVKSSGPSQTTAREDVRRIHGFRNPALVIYQTRIQKKLHCAKAFPGICCATAVHCPGLSRCKGLVVSISSKSISEYPALPKIRHRVAVLRCSSPCSTPGVCWWIKGCVGIRAAVKRVALEHQPRNAEQMTIGSRFWAQVPRCAIPSRQCFVAQVAF